MARKPALTADTLAELGVETLARLVLAEAERDPGFRRQVKAALAGRSGPGAVAKLIDRRLAGLERARSFVEWDKTRAFADDLRSLIDAIASELAPAAPALALDRLLRFVATHAPVFDRVDDSAGRVQDVYYGAIAEAGELAPRLTAPEAELLPARIMAALGESDHGYLIDMTAAVAPHLPAETLARWDVDLAAAIDDRTAEEAARPSDGWTCSMTSQWTELRSLLARARGDLDEMIALEAQKPPHRQDILGMAARLLEAGRADEALDWARRPRGRGDGGSEAALSPPRADLEARILDAQGNRTAACDLRWRCFETTLSADILRTHLAALPDFEDIEAEERALALAGRHSNATAALSFFLDWQRLDLAADLVVARRDEWDGRAWHTLPAIADRLAADHPLAATILYRALLDDILAAARSKAYRHGAAYLTHLDRLAIDAGGAWPVGVEDHATYRAGLRERHPRKSAFWRLVDNPADPPAQPDRGRAPTWMRRTS